jgi:hypothetical protein
VVAGVDVQNHALACPRGGNFNVSAIPNGIHKIGMPYPRKRRFGRERHGDFSIKAVSFKKLLFKTNLGIIDFKIPYAIETLPILAQSVGTGMLTSWNVVHVFSPLLLQMILVFIITQITRGVKIEGNICGFVTNLLICLDFFFFL